jgi:Tol biopolymer transport system component
MLKQICISFAFPMFALAQAPYASEKPMAEPTIFGKGIISGGDFDSHPAFTSYGHAIYFVRSAPNFSFWTIFVSRFENGHWTPPEVAPFSGQYSDADPFVTADGKQFYFLSKRPVNGRAKTDNDIWVMNKTETGWSEPRHLDAPVNSDGDEWYPTLTRNGTIYFGSDRAGGHGKTDLYRARLVDGKYATAENLGEPVSTAADEYEPFIAPDESSLIFMAAGRSDSLGRGDLYVSYRRGEKWSEPQNLGKKINSDGTEYSPKISPDGKYFFWSSTRGLTEAPMEKRLDTAATLEKFRSAGNGLGDIYQIDLSELRLEGKIDK